VRYFDCDVEEEMKFWMLIAILLPIWGGIVYKRLDNVGAFRGLSRNSLLNTYKSCHYVNIRGVEDLAVHRKTMTVFLSVQNRKMLFHNGSDPDTGIYIMKHFGHKDSAANKAKLNGFPKNQTWNPHGISFLETKRGEALLFVIDHRPEGEYIHLFEHRNGQLYYRGNFTDPLFVSLSDIVAVSNTSFYVTNDHAVKPPTGFMEDILDTCSSNVVFFNSTARNATVVADGLCFANGITANGGTLFLHSELIDQSSIYVTETRLGTLDIFQRDKKSGTLTLDKKIQLDLAVDHVEFYNNQLVIGAQRSLLDTAVHMLLDLPCGSFCGYSLFE